MSEVAAKDPRFYVEMMAHSAWGWAGSEEARASATDILERLRPNTFELITQSTLRDDVRDCLAQIRAPTLVLHRRERRFPPEEAARALAANILGAQLVVLEGDSVGPYAGDVESVHKAIDEFLGDGPAVTPQVEGPDAEARSGSRPTAVSGAAVILFADVKGYQYRARTFQALAARRREPARDRTDGQGGLWGPSASPPLSVA